MDAILDALDTPDPARRFGLDLETGELEPLLEPGVPAGTAEVPKAIGPLGSAWAERRGALLAEATAWLHGLGVEPIYEVGTRQPPSVAAPMRDGPTLLDLAILGVPPDPPAMEDGQVLRRLVASSPEAARRAFKTAAAALAAVHGQAAPVEVVEGTAVTFGRARLVLDGERVDLWLEVPPAVQRQFKRR